MHDHREDLKALNLSQCQVSEKALHLFPFTGELVDIAAAGLFVVVVMLHVLG